MAQTNHHVEPSRRPQRPYPGLRPFDADEACLFFGRDHQSLRMATILARQHFLAVVGTSGCGKSSLVKAGLLPELNNPDTLVGNSDRHWLEIVARPGGGPYRNLANALVRQSPDKTSTISADNITADYVEQRLRAGRDGLIDAIYAIPEMISNNVIVVIDQFEEIFRFGDTSHRSIGELERTQLHDDAIKFVDMLLTAVEARNPQIFLAITMRSDSIGKCDLFEGLPEAITRCQFLPPRMTKEQLLDAIRRPLELFHSTIEDAVVSDLLEAMGDRQDQLPVIQHALAQLWFYASEGKQPGEPRHITSVHAERCRLPVTDKSHIPPRLAWVTDAISTHADAVYNELAGAADGSPAVLEAKQREQKIARAMFCALSQIDNNQEPERRLSSLDEIARIVFGPNPTETELKQTEFVARVFAAEGRHFVVRSTTADGRDVLDISHESLLRQWKSLRVWINDEAKSAERYEELCTIVRRIRETKRPEYLSEAHFELARRWWNHKQPTVQWAMRYDGATSPEQCLLQDCEGLITSSLEEYKRLKDVENRRREDEEKQKSEQEQARVREAETQTRRARDAELAALREQELLKEKAEIETQRARDAEAASIRARRITFAAIAACLAAVISLGFALEYLREARIATTQAKTASIKALDKEREATEAAKKEFEAKIKAEASRSVAESLLDNSSRQNAEHFWRFAVLARDAKDSDPIKASHLFLRGADSLDSIILKRKTVDDVKRTANYDLAASVGDQQIRQSWVHAGPINGCKLSRDESRVLTWSDDGMARLWDVTKPEPLQTFKHDSLVLGAKFSRDESRVLTWSDDGTARLWDVTKPEPLQTFEHDFRVTGAQFSRDESRVLTWSGDGTARLWEVTKSEPLQTFKHGSAVKGAQFSRDELRVLTWGDDDMAQLWDTTKPEPIQTFKHNFRVTGARFSRDESRVLTWSYDGTARLWDLSKPEPIQTFKHDFRVTGAQFSRDESRVLTWSGDGTARLWDVTNPEPLQTFKHESEVKGAQFSSDELRVLTWSDDGTARLWDTTKPKPLRTFKHESRVNGALFSRDEARVLTWSNDGTARLWDVMTTEPI